MVSRQTFAGGGGMPCSESRTNFDISSSGSTETSTLYFGCRRSWPYTKPKNCNEGKLRRLIAGARSGWLSYRVHGPDHARIQKRRNDVLRVPKLVRRRLQTDMGESFAAAMEMPAASGPWLGDGAHHDCLLAEKLGW